MTARAGLGSLLTRCSSPPARRKRARQDGVRSAVSCQPFHPTGEAGSAPLRRSLGEKASVTGIWGRKALCGAQSLPLPLSSAPAWKSTTPRGHSAQGWARLGWTPGITLRLTAMRPRWQVRVHTHPPFTTPSVHTHARAHTALPAASDTPAPGPRLLVRPRPIRVSVSLGPTESSGRSSCPRCPGCSSLTSVSTITLRAPATPE